MAKPIIVIYEIEWTQQLTYIKRYNLYNYTITINYLYHLYFQYWGWGNLYVRQTKLPKSYLN